MSEFFDLIGRIVAAPFICMGWLLVAFLAGGLARYFMRSDDFPFWNDILLGGAGALLGGYISGSILQFDPQTTGLLLVIVNLLVATVTAMILIYIGHRVFGKPTRRKRR